MNQLRKILSYFNQCKVGKKEPLCSETVFHIHNCTFLGSLPLSDSEFALDLQMRILPVGELPRSSSPCAQQDGGVLLHSSMCENSLGFLLRISSRWVNTELLFLQNTFYLRLWWGGFLTLILLAGLLCSLLSIWGGTRDSLQHVQESHQFPWGKSSEEVVRTEGQRFWGSTGKTIVLGKWVGAGSSTSKW